MPGILAGRLREVSDPANAGISNDFQRGFEGPFDCTRFNMGIEIIEAPITRSRLRDIAAGQFGDFVKAVVDVERGLMAIGGDLHADEEATLLDAGSDHPNLWGINLYPDLPPDQWVEFDSMINVRPSESNRSREVENPLIREKILAIAARLVKD